MERNLYVLNAAEDHEECLSNVDSVWSTKEAALARVPKIFKESKNVDSVSLDCIELNSVHVGDYYDQVFYREDFKDK